MESSPPSLLGRLLSCLFGRSHGNHICFTKGPYFSMDERPHHSVSFYNFSIKTNLIAGKNKIKISICILRSQENINKL